MARLLTTAFIVALLAATAGAFAITEKLKLQKSPIARTTVLPKVFSPECACVKSVATIRFNLRERDRLTVWMEHDGRRAATLVSNRPFPAGPVTLAFDGIAPSGLTLPDGVYKPVVRLDRKGLTIELPGPSWLRLDTKPPEIHTRHRVYTHISPDGDGHNDVFRTPYRLSDPARALLFADGRQVMRTYRFERLEGELRWNGKFGKRTARQGPHVMTASAEDRAGNRAKPFPFAIVTIRYVRLGRDRVIARPGTHFAILVLADAPRVDWLFNRSRGTIRTGNGRATLRLKAPKKPGVYRLYVRVGDHAAKALVTVA